MDASDFPRNVRLLLATRAVRSLGQGVTVASFSLYLHALGYNGTAIGTVLMAGLMFGAALSALVILLVGSVRSGEPRQIKRALLAALVFDLQFPIFIGSQPAWFDYQEADVGMPPFLIWIVFVVLVGVTVYGLRTLQQPERQ